MINISAALFFTELWIIIIMLINKLSKGGEEDDLILRLAGHRCILFMVIFDFVLLKMQ